MGFEPTLGDPQSPMLPDYIKTAIDGRTAQCYINLLLFIKMVINIRQNEEHGVNNTLQNRAVGNVI